MLVPSRLSACSDRGPTRSHTPPVKGAREEETVTPRDRRPRRTVWEFFPPSSCRLVLLSLPLRQKYELKSQSKLLLLLSPSAGNALCHAMQEREGGREERGT